jgi:hypothetical protein
MNKIDLVNKACTSQDKAMDKLIKNEWRRKSGEPFATAQILRHGTHPEGLDVERIRYFKAGALNIGSGVGHIISVIKGSGILYIDESKHALRLEAGVHLYIPHTMKINIEAKQGTELLCVSSPTATQARGQCFLLRDETFIMSCASGSQSLRWILTPQYLSRRIFLHHDQTLLSKSGHPVSWFRTTMFDVAGLPTNEDGEPVFKMSYNSRTEYNVCYDVRGFARVRMARHPYRETKQLWSPWLTLDSDSTYHLNEAAGSPEEECYIDAKTNTSQFLRNKHEVYIADGHVSLFCMFDPSPTGIERHRPGEYSDYEALSKVLGTELYETHKREIARYDKMVDQLSLAKSKGRLHEFCDTPVWQLYLRGRAAQAAIEDDLAKTIAIEGSGREKVLARWMKCVTD